MLVPRWFILVLLVCCALPVKAQSDVDSLRQIWNDNNRPDSTRFQALHVFYDKYDFSMPDSVRVFSEWHYHFAKQRQLPDEMARALNEKALSLLVRGAKDSALNCLEEAVEIRLDLDDSLGVGRLYANIGSIYRQQSDFRQAVRYYTKALAVFEAMDRQLDQARLYSNLALIYQNLKMYEVALEHLDQSLNLFEKLDQPDRMGHVWLVMGNVHNQLGNHQQAIAYSRKALNVFQNRNFLVQMTDCYYSLANTYQSLNLPDSAMAYVRLSLKAGEQLGSPNRLLNPNLLLANLLLENNPEEATRIAEGIKDLAQSNPDKTVLTNVYELLYKCYKALGRTDEALVMHEAYTTYYDSIIGEENRMAVVREAIQSEFDAKLSQAELENQKKQAKLETSQLNQLYTIGFIGIIIIALLLLYYRSRMATHRRQRAELLQELEALKQAGSAAAPPVNAPTFQLNREKLEQFIGRKLNETDWTVLNILLGDPVLSNKEIAAKAFLSVDGIGSSLKRMYVTFEVKESKYKKISLLMEAIKLSNAVS